MTTASNEPGLEMGSEVEPLRVLFVCLGNICRSPTAEAVFRYYVECAGLKRRILVDSAGTHGFGEKQAPDKRARIAAARRGYDLESRPARRISDRDFSEFDYILSLDRQNLKVLEALCPPEDFHKLGLLMEYGSLHPGLSDVPDPFFGGPEAFERALDLIEDAAQGLLVHLRVLVNRRSQPLA
jgi:protein-tyrosine phosphatase